MVDPTEQVRSRLKKAYGGQAPPKADAADERPDIEQVIRDNSDLVRRIARRYARATGAVIDVDDLVSVGVMGLIQAHQNYDPAGGRPFRTYAEFRIRGSILDELRRLDPMSQPLRRKVRRFEAAVAELAADLGREPSEEELAAHLEVSLEKVQKMRRELQQVRFVAPESGDIDDIRLDLSRMPMDRAQLRVMLASALRRLAPRDQKVISLYYFHDMKLREIGEILEVTEARVCQLHKAAVKQLRGLLVEDGGDA